MRFAAACSLLLALGAPLAGCAEIDPYDRDGAWHPLGANAANLRAMAADPRDLLQGRGTLLSSGDMAAAAVARLRDDRVKRLPKSAISGVQTSDGGAGAPEPSEGATAAAPVAVPAAVGVSQ